MRKIAFNRNEKTFSSSFLIAMDRGAAIEIAIECKINGCTWEPCVYTICKSVGIEENENECVLSKEWKDFLDSIIIIVVHIPFFVRFWSNVNGWREKKNVPLIHKGVTWYKSKHFERKIHTGL